MLIDKKKTSNKEVITNLHDILVELAIYPAILSLRSSTSPPNSLKNPPPTSRRYFHKSSTLRHTNCSKADKLFKYSNIDPWRIFFSVRFDKNMKSINFTVKKYYFFIKFNDIFWGCHIRLLFVCWNTTSAPGNSQTAHCTYHTIQRTFFQLSSPLHPVS